MVRVLEFVSGNADRNADKEHTRLATPPHPLTLYHEIRPQVLSQDPCTPPTNYRRQLKELALSWESWLIRHPDTRDSGRSPVRTWVKAQEWCLDLSNLFIYFRSTFCHCLSVSPRLLLCRIRLLGSPRFLGLSPARMSCMS